MQSNVIFVNQSNAAFYAIVKSSLPEPIECSLSEPVKCTFRKLDKCTFRKPLRIQYRKPVRSRIGDWTIRQVNMNRTRLIRLSCAVRKQQRVTMKITTHHWALNEGPGEIAAGQLTPCWGHIHSLDRTIVTLIHLLNQTFVNAES